MLLIFILMLVFKHVFLCVKTPYGSLIYTAFMHFEHAHEHLALRMCFYSYPLRIFKA